MKIVIRRQENRIRLVVFSFSLFVALMLYQTNHMGLGTITASATLILTIATYFLQGKGMQGRFVVNKPVLFLAFFLFYSVMVTEFSGIRPSGYVRYIAQATMCLVLFSVRLNPREHRYLKNVFIAAAAVYAVLILWSYAVNQIEGRIHGHVVLFNTELDPNFVGIPLVAASVLLLDDIFKKHNRVLSVLLYTIVAGTIVYTASRGSAVALVCANMLIYVMLLFQKDMPLGKRILHIVLPLLGILVLIEAFSLLFPAEWERITDLGKNADNGRIKIWLIALRSWWENPLFGKGLGYLYRVYGYAAHSTYLQVLCGTGIIGFTFFCCFTFHMLNKARKIDTALFCMLVGMLVQFLFLDALYERGLWIALSWIAMLPYRGENVYEAYGQTATAEVQKKKVNLLR